MRKTKGSEKRTKLEKNIKHVYTLTNHSARRMISARRMNMWNTKKYLAIAAIGTGLAIAAASPASACGGWGWGGGYGAVGWGGYGGWGGGCGGCGGGGKCAC